MGLGDLHGLFRVSLGIKDFWRVQIRNYAEAILSNGAKCYIRYWAERKRSAN